MRTSLCSLVIAGLTLSLGMAPLRAADNKEKEKDADRLNDRVHDINDLARKRGMMTPALKTISNETGVPLERVEAMHKKYDETGPAGLMLACVLAAETKKEPESFIKTHSSGKGWGAIARDNNVPTERLTTRLDHMERFVSAPADKSDKREREREKKKRD